MIQAAAFPLRIMHLKLTSWETSLDKILMQVDSQDFSRAKIITSNMDSGELILVVNSTKTKEGHPIGRNNKGLTSMREQQCWKKLLLNSCRFHCQIIRALSRPLKI